MENFLFLNKFFIILINIVGLSIAFWVLLTDKKSKINQLFFVTTFFILSWISLVYFASISRDINQAIFLSRIAFVPVYLFLTTAYFFVIYFPREEKRGIILDISILLSAVVLSFITVFTDFHVKGVIFKDWGVSPVLGNGAILIYLIIFLIALLFSGILLKKYHNLSRGEKLKIQYFLIGFFSFVIMNVIFNVFLATKYTAFPYYLIGNYSAIFLIGFTAFAIVKQNLFGIRVVLTQILVGAIAILLFVQIIDSQGLIEYIWKSGLFLVFLIFGWLLIRSVLREIKLREELQRAYAELEKLDKAKSEFISIASHQLRTPLTAIKGYISMILGGSYGKISGLLNGKLQNVLESNERLIRLINDLLSMSRIESGKIELNLQKSALESIITSVFDVLSLEAKRKKITLKWDKPKAPLPELMIDPDKIREVILNLVDNALKYTHEGNIEVATKQNGGSMLITIADTGAGMTQEEINKLFRSFSRGTAGAQNFTEGVGLGLFIARKFVEMHNGRIWVESAGKGKGSTFFVELPISSIIEAEKFIKNF